MENDVTFKVVISKSEYLILKDIADSMGVDVPKAFTLFFSLGVSCFGVGLKALMKSKG